MNIKYLCISLLTLTSLMTATARAQKADEYAWVAMGVGYLGSHPSLYDNLRSQYGFSKKTPNKEYNMTYFKGGYQAKGGFRCGAIAGFFDTDSYWNITNKRLIINQTYGGIFLGQRFFKGEHLHGGVDLLVGLGNATLTFLSDEVNGAAYGKFTVLEPTVYLDVPFLFMEGALSFSLSYRLGMTSLDERSGADLGPGSLVDNAVAFTLLLAIGNFRAPTTIITDTLEK